MESYILDSIGKSIETKKAILQEKKLLSNIQKCSSLCIDSFKRGNKVILAGNGGSAADAQHIAAEFVSRFEFDRPGLASIALTTDSSMLTAIGNDYGFDRLFARQLEANGREGDIFIGISTSGNSSNVIEAIGVAREMNITSVALCGNSGKLKDIADLSLNVPSVSTPRIQEAHIMIGHIICGIVENEIFG